MLSNVFVCFVWVRLLLVMLSLHVCLFGLAFWFAFRCLFAAVFVYCCCCVVWLLVLCFVCFGIVLC